MFIEENPTPFFPAELKFQMISHPQAVEIQLNRCRRLFPAYQIRIAVGAVGMAQGGIVNRLEDIRLSLSILAQKDIDIRVKVQLYLGIVPIISQ